MLNGERPCCRCGSRRRDPDLYLCSPCSFDPVQKLEIDDVAQAAKGIRKQRALLISRHKWTGGWTAKK